MICGAEDLAEVCQRKIAAKPHTLSADGKFSWEEVECLGACANAPMAQIGKDYYEDLTPERLEWLLDELAAGRVPVPGPQNGRYASEPKSGLTSLKDFESGRTQYNASVQAAVDIGDTVKRIDGTEVPLIVSWKPKADSAPAAAAPVAAVAPVAPAPAAPVAATPVAAPVAGKRPAALAAARGGKPDNLKDIKGIGPKLELLCHSLGFYHFDQIAAWTAEEIAWVDDNLEGFKGRVTRDDWVGQAKILAAGGETEFSKKVEDGKVYE
jgi:NADH-quinone oxidoreductase subunit E